MRGSCHRQSDQVFLSLVFEMLFAIGQNCVGLPFVQQVQGKMGGNVAQREGHHGPLF